MIDRVVPACDLSKSVDDAFRVDVERVLDLTRVISGVTNLVEINVKNVAFRFCRAMTVPGQRAILTILKPDFRGRDASYLAPPAQLRTGPIRAYGLYGAFFVKGGAHHFVAPLFVDSFVRPAPRAIFRPDRILAVAVARSEGQGRRFFNAAEGLSLTNASTAANCP